MIRWTEIAKYLPVHYNSKTSIDKLEKTGQGRPDRLPVLEEEIKKKAKLYRKRDRQTERT